MLVSRTHIISAFFFLLLFFFFLRNRETHLCSYDIYSNKVLSTKAQQQCSDFFLNRKKSSRGPPKLYSKKVFILIVHLKLYYTHSVLFTVDIDASSFDFKHNHNRRSNNTRMNENQNEETYNKKKKNDVH